MRYCQRLLYVHDAASHDGSETTPGIKWEIIRTLVTGRDEVVRTHVSGLVGKLNKGYAGGTKCKLTKTNLNEKNQIMCLLKWNWMKWKLKSYSLNELGKRVNLSGYCIIENIYFLLKLVREIFACFCYGNVLLFYLSVWLTSPPNSNPLFIGGYQIHHAEA